MSESGGKDNHVKELSNRAGEGNHLAKRSPPNLGWRLFFLHVIFERQHDGVLEIFDSHLVFFKNFFYYSPWEILLVDF